MTRRTKYLFNGLLLSSVAVLMRSVAVVFNAYVTKKIGAEALGLFTLVMSVYTLAVTLATSSVNLAAVRLISERLALCDELFITGAEKRKALRRDMTGCIKYSLFFGIFAGLLLFFLSDIIGIYILKDERCIISLRVLSVTLPAISLSSALAGYFTGLRKVSKNAVISLFEQFVKISVTCALLVTVAPKGIEYACLAVVGGSAISEGTSMITALVLYFFDERKAKKTHSKKKAALAFDPLKRAGEIALPVAVGSYARQGLICAEHIAIPRGLRRFGASGSDALKSYGVLHGMAFPIILFPSTVISAFSSLLIPELSESSSLGKKTEITSAAEKTVKLSLAFSIGAACIFLSFGEGLGTAVYNNGDAGYYIKAVAPLVPIMYLDTAVDAVLKGIGEQVYCMKVNILDAFLSLVLVLVLVPKMGVAGYIVCIYITEFVNDTLSIIRMIKRTNIRLSIRWVTKPFLISLLSTVPVKLVFGNIAGGDIYIEVALSSLIYIGISALLLFRERSPRQLKKEPSR